MKTLKQHIDEALKIGKNISDFSIYSCQPKTKEELEQIINDRISKEGTNCDLNDIDTSLITDMAWLFHNMEFNGDISKWDVSNVKYMDYMFLKSGFNGDISNWDVSKMRRMDSMFYKSKFNNDISNWKINSKCDTYNMFAGTTIKEQFKPKLPS